MWVFIPNYRRKALYGPLRQLLCGMFRELARHKECEIGEGHSEATVRLYIQEQEKADQRLDQQGLFGGENRFERLQD